MELANVEFRLRQNPLGLGQWIIFERWPRSCLTRNLRPRIGSQWRLSLYDLPGRLCGPFGFQTSPDTADVRSQAGDAESDPGVFF